MSILNISNLNVHYGVIHALKDINFSINTGEIVTLIGANGAGKSTILRTISGLVSKSSGTIEFEGQEISHLTANKIASLRLNQVPEGRRVFTDLSVQDNLKLGAFLRKDRKKIAEDLENVYDIFPRLFERKKQRAGSLSGGEQQMLAMGRGLMNNPKLLLLDEPSMGLAPLLVQEIFRVIKDINKLGTTILLVEQNANLALEIANRAYVLETGSITLSGDAKVIRDDKGVKEAYLGI